MNINLSGDGAHLSFAGKFDGTLSDGQGSQPHGHGHVDSVSTHAPAGAIIVQDAHLLFTGDFKRSGVDLILSADDRKLVLHDYFKGEKHAALASPDGAHLTGDIVDALSGYTQFAQADGSASVAQVIGHVTKLTGTATVIRNGVSIILNQGDNVNKGDVVQSGSDSSLGITFIDGSVFGLASNAKMVLNEMIYDPNGSNNSSLISLVQGTISFVAGATAKHGDMKVDTPVATMASAALRCWSRSISMSRPRVARRRRNSRCWSSRTAPPAPISCSTRRP
ncbi:FecR family protein [Bradyrhizobium sp. AZCC 2289]|uniref:FecR family protein n=1 Tax=Bradyrhizobium sp. AZCC 2289 TaxID=3117026 RepID=UPI002FF286B5